LRQYWIRCLPDDRGKASGDARRMTTATHDRPVKQVSPRNQDWLLLILLSVAQFMVIIDATVVNVALPSIGRDLGFATAADLQWVVTAYVLVTGGLTLLGGRMADLLNRRRIFLVGLAIFTTASLTTGLSPAPGLLIASRAAQGLGAALLTPAALAIITTAYEGAQRTAALAVWGALGAAGAAVGLVLGGVLTSWFGWQWVFFINVPIGVAAAAIGLFMLPTPPRGTGRLRDLDVAGALTLIAGLVMLVLAITAGTGHGWTSAQAGLSLVLSVGLLATFATLERKVKQPIVPPSTWRLRSLVSGNAMYLGASAVMGGSFFLSSLYVQSVVGAPPWLAGLAFLPLALMVGVAGKLGSALVSHMGIRPVLMLGLAVEGGGALLLAHVPAEASYVANVLPGFVGIGFGLGLAFVAVPLLVMGNIRDADTGMASGMMQTAHEIGISLGVAVISAVATAGTAAAGFDVGFRDAMFAAALIAVVLAVASLAAVPSVRPTSTR
jgi:EmrB/QacA subfamily drug resistance transporter